MEPSGESVFKRILSGYGQLFTAIGLWIGASIAAVAIAAAIVWPLWALAVHRRAIFNLLFICLAALSFIAFLFLSLRKQIAAGRKPLQIFSSFARQFSFILLLVVEFFSLYAGFTWASRGFLAGGIPAFGLTFILSGYLFFGRKRRQ